MRKAILLLAVFGLAGSLWAADPIIGTWKLNVAKSKFSPLGWAAPKEQSETYREIDGKIELTWKNVETNGTTLVSIITFPSQGGSAKCSQFCMEGVSFVQTLIAGERYVTYLRDGKQFQTRHKAVSKDGKTMRQTLRSVNDEGQPFELLLVFDRQ